MIDTGANITCISAELLQQLRMSISAQPLKIKQLTSSTQSLGCVPISLTIGSITQVVKAHVLKGANQELILGVAEGALFKLNIDLAKREIKQDNITIPEYLSATTASSTPKKPLSKGTITTQQEEAAVSCNGYEHSKLKGIVAKYNQALETRDREQLYTVPDIEHSIITTNDTPVASCAHRLTLDKRDKITNIIQELLEEGKVQRSSSSYASPAFLVGKKDGSLRMVIDYRKLNDITLVEPHPIPRMDTLLDGIRSPRYFSVIDLKGAYHHIRMNPSDIAKTAFVTPDGHFEWKVMPFGLKNAPATFARYMNEFVRKYQLKNTIVYFDDILIATANLESHLGTLELLFQALIKENLTVNTDKCHFLKDSVEYLGITLNRDGITAQRDKARAIQEMPRPRNKHEIMRFLGMINFYHRFIPNFAIHAIPLHNLLRKDNPWSWTDECQDALDKLKNSITTGQVLVPFQRNKATYLYTDASGVGIGAVLKQEHGGEERAVAFFSKRLSAAQMNYSTSEQEALAIVAAIEHWKYYLDGHRFTIKTDHKPLTWLRSITDKNRRLFNWSIKLSTYDYKVEYLPGETNREADALSRAPTVNLVTLQQVRNALERSQDTIPTQAQVEDGIIYVNIDGSRKLYVPESLRLTIMEESHKQFGHLGVRAMMEILQLKYHWPHVARDIKHFVDNCTTCATCKNYHQPRKGELRQIPPVHEPLEMVSMDSVGGFRNYGSVKTNMTIIVDHATRYAWTFGSRSITDDQAISSVSHVLNAHGHIGTLLTDRYPAYFSGRLRTFLDHNNVIHRFTTPYHPNANGICERINRTIVNKLRCLKNDNPRKSWIKLLKEATAQYNNTIHSATGFPPSYLLMGRTSHQYINENNSFPPLQEARQLAILKIQEQHTASKRRHDEKQKPVDLKVGDLVYTKTPQQVNIKKLTPPFEGPWRITAQVSPTVFEIDKRDQQRNQPTTHYHCSMLKKAPIRVNESTNAPLVDEHRS